jgi:hypothetical protein
MFFTDLLGPDRGDSFHNKVTVYRVRDFEQTICSLKQQTPSPQLSGLLWKVGKPGMAYPTDEAGLNPVFYRTFTSLKFMNSLWPLGPRLPGSTRGMAKNGYAGCSSPEPLLVQRYFCKEKKLERRVKPLFHTFGLGQFASPGPRNDRTLDKILLDISISVQTGLCRQFSRFVRRPMRKEF